VLVIYSFFSFRCELKIAGPDVQFKMNKCTPLMKFLFLKVKTAKEIYNEISVDLKIKNCNAQFKTEHFSTEDEDCPGRPIVVTEPENVDAVHSMILAHQRISAKKTAEILEISQECVEFIIHDVLDMRKLPAKWTPKCLNADQIRLWHHSQFFSTCSTCDTGSNRDPFV
jgi:hypothetical protein